MNDVQTKNGFLDSNGIMVEDLSPSSRYKLKMEVQKGNLSILVVSERDFETLSSLDVQRSGLGMENKGTDNAEENGSSTKSDGMTSTSKNDTETASGKLAYPVINK